ISSGTYILTVTDTESGCSGMQSITITQGADVPVVNINPSASEITCAVTSITLDGSASTVIGTPAYSWTTTNGVIQSGAEEAMATIISSGTYILTVTDTESGCSGMQSITITQSSDVPVVNINPSASEITCSVSSIILEGSSNVPTAAYSWTTVGGVISSDANAQNITLTAAGTYILSVTNTETGCTGMRSIEIGQSLDGALPAQPSEINGNVSPCSGAEEVYSVQLVSGISYYWTIPSDWAIREGQGSNSILVTIGSSGGTLSVTPSNICGEGPLRLLHVEANSTPFINNPGNQSACDYYKLPVISGADLSGNQAYYSFSNRGGIRYNAGDTIAENAILYIYDNNGECSSEESFQITINTLEVNLGNDIEICEGEEYKFEINEPFLTCWWNDSIIGNSYTVTEPGAVVVSVIDQNLCNATDTVLVTVFPNPVLNLGNDTVICDEEGFELKADDFAIYDWSDGSAVSSIIIYPGEKEITLTVTDYNGCTTTDTIRIIECEASILGEITNVFTPNGDKINDTWIINNIELFPDAYIEVFDRWGRKVYQKNGGYTSQNAWDGTYKGKLLPLDNYYYVIDLLGNGKTILKGNLTILK
ncbi:MAG: gliding motility-associated C-terminal domain-containing protein, partial [Bacteroidales bacterium]|nr:gliding motility-associated C-terminal domain-containing protein [Bacteroidales bacterium]